MKQTHLQKFLLVTFFFSVKTFFFLHRDKRWTKLLILSTSQIRSYQRALFIVPWLCFFYSVFFFFTPLTWTSSRSYTLSHFFLGRADKTSREKKKIKHHTLKLRDTPLLCVEPGIMCMHSRIDDASVKKKVRAILSFVKKKKVYS